MMGKYDISTDVFNTYVADFHGTTVTIFDKQSPDQATNKAVCYDCHGVHDIKSVSDPEATVVKENLLVTCQRCHPDAEANFPLPGPATLLPIASTIRWCITSTSFTCSSFQPQLAL